jgi:hypothetical protein
MQRVSRRVTVLMMALCSSMTISAGPAGQVPERVTVAGQVVVERGLPRPVFRFRLINEADQEFKPDVAHQLSAIRGTPAPRIHEATDQARRGSVFTEWIPIQAPPGNYWVAISELPAGYSVKSIVVAGSTTDLQKEPFRVSSNAQRFTITLTADFQRPPVRVTGRVVNAASRPVSAGVDASGGATSPVTAIALASAAYPNVAQGSLGPKGLFYFPQVYPGVYQLIALPHGEEDAAATIVVKDSDVLNLEVTAPPVRCATC